MTATPEQFPLKARQEASRLLLAMWRRRWKVFALDSLIGTVFFLVGMVPGLIIMAFFDALASWPATTGWTGPALILMLFGVKFVHGWLGVAFEYADSTVRSAMTRLVQLNLLRRMLTLRAGGSLEVPVGDAVNRLNTDVRESVWTLTNYRSGLTSLTSSTAFTVVAMAVMTYIDARIALLSLIPVLAVVTVSYLTGNLALRYRTRTREAAGDVAGLLTEGFSAVQGIKLAAAEDAVVKRLVRLNSRRRTAAVREETFSLALQGMSAPVLAVGTGLILLAALQPMQEGAFSVGRLALFMYLLAEVGIGAAVAGGFLSYWRQAQANLLRLGELQKGLPLSALATGIEDMPVRPVKPAEASLTPPPRSPPSDERLETLTVRGLGARHPDGSVALRDVSFTLRRGTVTVVTGGMGSGKSTLLRCLLGMSAVESGAVEWNDEPVSDLAGFFVPPHSAYIPQVPRLFSGSIRDNLLLGTRLSPQQQDAAMQTAVFDADLEELPHGYDTHLGPSGHRLSGGQVQRLAAARTFSRHAELLVIDDLSSALDNRTVARLWNNVSQMAAAGRTVLAVSHRREVLDRADQILVMENGTIAAAGTPAELVKGSETFRAIWESGAPRSGARKSSRRFHTQRRMQWRKGGEDRRPERR